MIHSTDVMVFFIEECGWKIRDRTDYSDWHTLLWVERSKKNNEIWSLNFIINQEHVRVLNRYKDTDYIEADVYLFDPSSVDSIEKILK